MADFSKFKSDEFIDSDEDASSGDERAKKSVKNEAKKSKTKPSGNRSLRGHSHKDEEMVSLGEEESESEAELTDEEDDEEESD